MLKKRYPKAKQIGLLLFFLLLAGTLTAVATAQDVSRLWSTPRLLSNYGVNDTSAAVLVPDPHGFLHVLWVETVPDTGSRAIQYAKFDGINWTEPTDLFNAPLGLAINSISSVLSSDGRLHLSWTQGNSGPVFYTSAPALEAGSAQSWATRTVLDYSAYGVLIQVDSKNNIHMMYYDLYGREPGIYYSHSIDQGEIWSLPAWIDPDIPTDYTPNILKFEIDDQDGLHASWYYVGGDGPNGLWIRYVHSLDGGQTWETPFTIDIADETEDELRIPYPTLAVSGDVVMIIYAGNTQTNREFRFSLDRGVTWSETKRVFGDLQGMALGDAVVVDAPGRFHFFGQIRWPQGVYHAIWDPAQPEEAWSSPEITYLIAENPDIGRQGRYHAHSVRAGVLNGNEPVVTFTDEATGPIYALWGNLSDVEPLPTQPVPLPTPVPEDTSTPVPLPTAIATPRPFANDSLVSPVGTPNVGLGLWLGVIPTALLLVAIVVFQIYRRKR